MAGHRSFSELQSKMPPMAQKRAAIKTELLTLQMSLAELRRAQKKSQGDLAKLLGVGQAAVAKLERRTDMHVSTLCRIVSALGGELRVVALIDGREVSITNTFNDEPRSREKVVRLHAAPSSMT